MTGARPHPTPGPLPAEQGAAPSAPTAAPPTASAPSGPAPSDDPRRSPVIAPGLVPALVTTALAALLAVTAYLPLPAYAGAVLVLQAVTAAGWFRLNGMWPARQGIALAFLAGVTADVAMLLVDGEHVLTVLVATLGVWFVLNVVLHLRNRSAPDERLYALTAALTATALTVIAGGYLALLAEGGEDAAAVVVIAAAGVAAAVLFRALPLPPYVSPAVAALAAAGMGFAVPPPGFPVSGTGAAGVGLAAGVCALVGLRTASYDHPSRFVHMTAGVALPLTLAAPAAYGLGLALT